MPGHGGGKGIIRELWHRVGQRRRRGHCKWTGTLVGESDCWGALGYMEVNTPLLS